VAGGNDRVDGQVVAARPLLPRAVRLRDACLIALARHTGLPKPSDDDLEAFSTEVGLEGAWEHWMRRHKPPEILDSDEGPIRDRPVSPRPSRLRRILAIIGWPFGWLRRRMFSWRILSVMVVGLGGLGITMVAFVGGAEAQRDTKLKASPELCLVLRVIDGDTIRCKDGGRVRLLLIDSPERRQKPFGGQATAYLKRLLPVGKQVLLERDIQRVDRYGRLLAYVHTRDGVFINEEMVRAGYAVVSVYPPNVRYVNRLRQAAKQARRENRGLWASSAFACNPRDRRAGRC
jgi:micrococcal nuclease